MKTNAGIIIAALGLATLNVSASTHYVSLESTNPVAPYTTWATAATSIQDAVDAARAGDTVLVTNGVYADGGRHSSRVAIPSGIRLEGVNGPLVTIIEGAPYTGGMWPSSRRCAYLCGGAVLSGFTLTRGCATDHGGGVYCESPNALVSNCVITGNHTYLFGSGDGGGAFGGTLYNCVIMNNFDVGGGAGAHGGTLYNCTLTGNWAPGYIGGGAYDCTLNNCILYYTTNGANYSECILNYCCTTPMPTYGVGNITNEPAFMDLAAGDFRLRPDSPCIDAGTNLAGLITTDILGLPRPMDGNNDGVARFDIGAYEFNPYRFEPTLQMNVDGFRFSVRGEPGRSVRIERSRDLVNWEFAGEVPIPSSGQTLIDPAATTEAHLFYRVVRVP